MVYITTVRTDIKRLDKKNYVIEYHALLVLNHCMCPSSYRDVRCSMLTLIMSVYPRA